MATSPQHVVLEAVRMVAATDILDAPDEVVIVIAGRLCLSVSKCTRWGAAWHWDGRRVPARWGCC